MINAIQSVEMGEGSLMLESLAGFFIIISAEEEIIFVSENVEKHMGITQVSDSLSRHGISAYLYRR